MTGNEIRAKFIDFFQKQNHEWVKSSSLVPHDDPSLLFTNAGMVQFKRVFTGDEKRGYNRAVTSQKCVRAGGKHNDLENVGYTARHHTFFEMLGNFSFGDYFKEKAIEFAWALLVDGFGLPADKLYATVYQDDDEAFDLWRKVVNLPEERISRLGDEDNFWSMGDTGPCGPCSEILIDQGEAMGCGRPDCRPGCDCDRYLELWNLVFMQFERDASGKMTPLPKPSIDTGMGLERISAVVQGVYSNFETDLFVPLIDYVQELSGVQYQYQTELMKTGQTPPQTNVSIRAIADHARSLAFLIGDGVLPENAGRGYVLRRILRRAVRHGRLLGIKKTFLHDVTGKVIDMMGQAYPDIKDGASYIQSVIQNEEERFSTTLDNGLNLLSDEMVRLKEAGKNTISGEVAFKLHDTYGFPLDLVQDLGRESGFVVDEAGFEAAMDNQRAMSRGSWKGSGEEAVPGPISELTLEGFKVEFKGYDTLKAESELVLILKDGEKVERAALGEEVHLVFRSTPFYGAAGGQVGDVGRIYSEGFEIGVKDTIRYQGDIIVHKGILETGNWIAVGMTFTLEVDRQARWDTMRHHTATHLLHRVLRQELGDHVKQAGSSVGPDRLRFDFTHFAAIGQDVLAKIESRVNEVVRNNLPVSTRIMSMADAMNTGAEALFEERYGDTVRVVSVGDFSSELCGGTHISRSGDIGTFLIVAEGSAAAGVRRMEALTGRAAMEAVQEERRTLRGVSEKLKAAPLEVLSRLEKVLADNRDLKKELEKGQQKQAAGQTDQILEQAIEVDGIKFLAAKVKAQGPKALREMGDFLKDKLGSGVIALGAESENKAIFLAIVSKDLTEKYHAGNMVKAMAQEVGGGGGGRPDMAQAGGPQADKIDQALEKAKAMITG